MTSDAPAVSAEAATMPTDSGTGPKLKYTPLDGPRYRQATLTQLSRSEKKKKKPASKAVTTIEQGSEAEGDFFVYDPINKSSSEDEFECSDDDSSDDDFDRKPSAKASTVTPPQKRVERQMFYSDRNSFNSVARMPAVAPPVAPVVEPAVAPVARTYVPVPLRAGTVTNASLPLTTDTVIYPMFGYMSSDKHSRDVLHVDVLIPGHAGSAINPTVHPSGKQLIITYGLYNNLYNESRVSAEDPEREYAMRSDFRRAVRLLPNGGAGATLTQVIDLPFVCDAEFYCEEEFTQGWRLCVEEHPDPAMADIGVNELYLCMQLLKLGEKKLKRICPEICVKTTKKQHNHKPKSI